MMMMEFVNFVFASGEAAATRLWLAECAAYFGQAALGRIQYEALAPEAMRALNQRLLSHDYCTDVITIPYEYQPPSYESYVCPEFVWDNAKAWGLNPREEWHRVLAHALLHMIGYDDKGQTGQAQMREAEDKCLILRPKLLKDKT